MSFNINNFNSQFNVSQSAFLGARAYPNYNTANAQLVDIYYPQYPLVPRHLLPFLPTFSGTIGTFQQAIFQEKRKEREDDSLVLAKRTKPLARKNTFSLTADETISLTGSAPPPSSSKGKLRKSPTRTCSSCGETKTAKRWYQNPRTGLVDRCQACYWRSRAREDQTKTCSSCGETKTAKVWLKNPITGLADRCQACYNRAREEQTKTCSSCGETKTAKRWSKNPITALADRCQACYWRSRRK
jgi:ribosomal protein L32